MVSLWGVSETGMKDLMLTFYHNILEEDLRPAQPAPISIITHKESVGSRHFNRLRFLRRGVEIGSYPLYARGLNTLNCFITAGSKLCVSPAVL